MAETYEAYELYVDSDRAAEVMELLKPFGLAVEVSWKETLPV